MLFFLPFHHVMKKKYVYLTPILFILFCLVLNIGIGVVNIPFKTILKILVNELFMDGSVGAWPSFYRSIIWQVRTPHALLIMMTGAALAGSGAAFQGLFKNPLADPYLIGVASGAGLGAVIALRSDWTIEKFGFVVVPLFAYLGALLTVYLVYQLAKVDQIVPVTTLILAGVAVGALASALTSLIILRSEDQLYRSMAFLFGGSVISGWKPVLIIAPYMLVGFVVLSTAGHNLNVLQFGDEQARQLGVSVERVKIFVVVTASLLAAAAVSFSGIIGFVGLIVPHLVRILYRPDYRYLIPLSILIGGGGLLLSDILARLLLAPQSLPVGIVTALIGSPFFLWILRKAKREVFW